jgi:hypothetical protein
MGLGLRRSKGRIGDELAELIIDKCEDENGQCQMDSPTGLGKFHRDNDLPAKLLPPIERLKAF